MTVGGGLVVASEEATSLPQPETFDGQEDFLRRGVATTLTTAALLALKNKEQNLPSQIATFLTQRGAQPHPNFQTQEKIRQLKQERFRLDTHLVHAYSRVHSRGTQRLSSFTPTSSDLQEAASVQARGYAKWHEARRLKKVQRRIKSRLGLGLDASDCLLPQGTILFCTEPGIDIVQLQSQLETLLGIICVREASAASSAMSSASTVLLQVTADSLPETVASFKSSGIPVPSSVLLLALNPAWSMQLVDCIQKLPVTLQVRQVLCVEGQEVLLPFLDELSLVESS